MADERMTAMIDRAVQARLRDGFGDPAAELEHDEFVSERKHCPHTGCHWTVDTEWRRGSTVTRWLGHANIERECQTHLEMHLPSLDFMRR